VFLFIWESLQATQRRHEKRGRTKADGKEKQCLPQQTLEQNTEAKGE
jgi:hypothetical protein